MKRKKSPVILIGFIIMLILSLSSCIHVIHLAPDETSKLTPPADPFPALGVTDVATEVTLLWECDNPDKEGLTYTIYLSKNRWSLKKIAENLSEKLYTLTDLDYQSQYYWRVEVKDPQSTETRNSAISEEWTFTTISEPYTRPKAPENPNPTDGATNITTDVTLIWEQENTDQRDLRFDVYFGKDSGELNQIATGLRFPELERQGLEYDTTYYWRVEVYDTAEMAHMVSENQSEATQRPRVTSEEWSFTTQEDPINNKFSYDLSINGVYALPADTVQFAVSFRNLQDPIDKIVLSGNGVDRTLTVIDSQAQLQDYLVDKGATEAVVKGYNGEQLRWQRPIALPQVMEVESIVPDYTTPLYDSYVVSLRINYNAITKIDDFTDINAGTFLHFRTTDDELVEYVPIEFNPDATTAVCTFKIFTDDQVTRGKLQTDTAAYLEIELK